MTLGTNRRQGSEVYNSLFKRLARRLGSARAQGEEVNMQRFTAYRRAISQRETHNSLQKNPDSDPQFEGVIWSDGTVTLRWLTACRSTAVWDSIADCLNIHGHPEYGTEIEWHDAPAPQAWLDKVARARP